MKPQAFFSILALLLVLQLQGQPADSLGLVDLSAIQKLAETEPTEAAASLRKQIEATADPIYFDHYLADYLELEKDTNLRASYLRQRITFQKTAQKIDTLAWIESLVDYAREMERYSDRQQESIATHDEAIGLWEQAFDEPTNLYAAMHFNRANAYLRLGQEGVAFEAQEKTSRILESVTDPDVRYLRSLYSSMATANTRYGFYDKAENFINKSVRLYQENQVLFDSAYADQLHYIPISAFTSYLRLYRSSGEEKKLLETAGKLERYVKGKQLDAGTAFQVSQAYTNLGHFYFGKRDHRTSLRYFKKARPALVPGSHPNYEVYYDMNVAKASMELGRNDKAFAIVDDVIVNERTTNTQLLGFMHAMRAILHARAKRKEEAFSDTQQMMEFFHQGDDPIDVRTAETVDGFRPSKRLNDAKLMRNHANDLALSFPLDMDMVVLTNNLCKMALRQFENCYSKNVYNPTLESLFRTLVRSVMTTNFYRYGHCDSDGTYVSKINNFEARFLWHNFLLNQQQEGVQRSDSLFAQRQRWQQELTVLEQQRQAAGADSSELAASIFDLSLRLERLGETLESEHRAYAHFSDYKFELSQFQRKLRPDQLILQYQLMMGQLFVFIIDRESISIYNLCDFPIIEPEVKTFVQALRQPQTDLDSLQSQAALLYEILRMEATEDYEDIIIVPDRILHYLPFGLLRHDGQYLLEEKHIHYATSLPILDFDWAARSSAAKGPGTFFAPSYEEFLLDDQQLVVRGSAYDLEGAQAEVGALSALTKGRAFVGREASKANFLQQAPGSRILHLSMHSYLNDEKPELSSMVFSDHESDHELFISELYGLRLGAELAVLSACNTGVGNLRKGEGVVSMSRAFTYAGVPATVSSLWSAPDQATKSIMLSFYENMQSGLSVGPALRQAKLQYLETVEDERFQHPYYWAGFVLHGQDRFLSFGSRNYSALLNWILGTLLVLGAWYVFGRSRRPRES